MTPEQLTEAKRRSVAMMLSTDSRERDSGRMIENLLAAYEAQQVDWDKEFRRAESLAVEVYNLRAQVTALEAERDSLSEDYGKLLKESNVYEADRDRYKAMWEGLKAGLVPATARDYVDILREMERLEAQR